MQPESAGPWELPHGLREDKGAQGAELSIWGSKECACAGQTFRKWEQVGDPVVEVMGVFVECGLCWTEHFDTHVWSWTPSLVASLRLFLAEELTVHRQLPGAIPAGLSVRLPSHSPERIS